MTDGGTNEEKKTSIPYRERAYPARRHVPWPKNINLGRLASDARKILFVYQTQRLNSSMTPDLAPHPKQKITHQEAGFAWRLLRDLRKIQALLDVKRSAAESGVERKLPGPDDDDDDLTEVLKDLEEMTIEEFNQVLERSAEIDEAHPTSS